MHQEGFWYSIPFSYNIWSSFFLNICLRMTGVSWTLFIMCCYSIFAIVKVKSTENSKPCLASLWSLFESRWIKSYATLDTEENECVFRGGLRTSLSQFSGLTIQIMQMINQWHWNCIRKLSLSSSLVFCVTKTNLCFTQTPPVLKLWCVLKSVVMLCLRFRYCCAQLRY